MSDPLGLFSSGSNDPLGLFSQLDKPEETSIWDDAKIGAANIAQTLNTFRGMHEGMMHSLVGNSEKASEQYKGMEDSNKAIMKWANPEGKEQSFSGKLIGMAATLPAQVISFPFNTATTGKTMLDEGESLSRAIGGTLLDAAGNVISVALPGAVGGTIARKAVTGAGINATQDVLTRQGISSLAEKKSTKEKLGPSWESTGLSAILGGALGPLVPSKSSKDVQKDFDARLKDALDNTPQDVQFWKDRAEMLQRDAQTANRLEAAINKQNPEYNDNIFVGREGNAIPGETGRAMAESTKGIEYESIPPGGTIPRSKPDGSLEVPKGNIWIPDENNIPVRQGIPENKLLPPETYHEGQAVNDLGNAIQEANGPKLGPDEPYGSENLSGPMGAPESRLKNATGNLLDAFLEKAGGKLNVQDSGNSIHKAIQEFAIALFDVGHTTLAAAVSRAKEILGTKWEKIRDIFPKYFKLASERGTLDAAILEATPEFKVPRSQRGALDLGPNLKAKQEAIEKIVKEKIFATPPKAEEVIAESTAHGKDSRGVNSMEAGASLAAMKRRSPLILGVSRIIQHAKNIAEDSIRTYVFPTERKLRSLKSEEITNLSKIMIEEERAGKRLSATQLADLGLSEKQLIAYESVREMSKQALARENAARAAQGKKPITEREAFVSSRWKGDFRRPFSDKEGRLKWYLAADSKRGLEIQTKALLEKFPELVQGKDHQTKSSRGFNEHPEEIYSLMVDVLGRDDPAVAKIHEWMMEQGVNEARGMLAQEKHFKNKSGVRGFVGDRPSNTLRGKLDQRKEALAFFQEQINYAKNAHKWSGMQEAAQELKKVFADKTLQEQQPNNMAYAKDYFRNQIGLSTHKAIAGLEDAVRETGISPHVLNNAIGDVKSLWITQKLVASAGFIASNVIQAANILPHLADMTVKYKGNPLYAIPMGLSSGILMAAGHMSIAAGKKGFYQTLSVLPKAESAFLTKAMKYAEDNSVVARSIYDEAPIASSFSKTTKIAQIGGKTITAPETVLRSIAYMTYVNMLKSSGKFKNDLDIFRLAEERTNISMADYRQGERAILFDKLGTVGNAMNTLQTFPINYYQQWNWAAREAGKGNVLPAAVMFATQAYVAGAMGIPGFADTDKLWNWMKELAAEHSPQLWDKMKDIDLKEIMLGMGNSALYGGLSEQSGISFTSRAAAPAGSEMLSSPLGPYQDFGRQLGDVGNAIVNPSAQSGAQALLSVAPTGMQGALEVGPLKDQTSVLNQETGKRVYGRTRDLASREGQVARSPQDELIRATGLRSQREVVERDQAYRLNKLQSDSNTVIAKLPNKIYNELRNNNMEKATDLINLYSRLSGSQISSQQIENEAIKEFTTSSQRATMGATTVPALVALKRLQQIQERQKGP